MARAKAKLVYVTARTDNGALDPRYADGVPPAPPDITVSQAIPDITAIPAGTSYSENFASYITGTGTAGSVASLEEITGTLIGVDLAFATTTLSGATPDVGSVALRLVVAKSGFTFRSNTFLRGVITVTTPDTLGPTIAPPPEVTVVDSTHLTAVTIVAQDPNPDGKATGMKELQWQRATVVSGVVGAFADVGSPVALGTGLTPTWTTGVVGSAPGTCTPSGANFNFSLTGGALGNTADVFAYAATPITGFFDFIAKITSWTSAEQWDERGIGIWQSLAADSIRFTVARFTPSLGRGITPSWRMAVGGARTIGSSLTTGVPTDVLIRIIRNTGSNTLTAYYYSEATGLWTQIVQQAVSMTDPVFLVCYGCRNALGTATVSSTQAVTVNKLGTKTLNDSGLTAATTYQYRTRQSDLAGTPNVTTGSASLSTTTAAAPGVVLRANYGHYGQVGGALRKSTPVSTYTAQANEFMSLSKMKGVMWPFSWSSICPTTRGVYTWTKLDQVMTLCRNAGKKLFLWQLAESVGPSAPITTFDNEWLPQFINSAPYAWYPMSYGLVPALWETPTMDAYIELFQAIGDRYDSDDTFEGIITDETAAAPNPLPPSFTWAKRIAEFKRFLLAVKPRFKRTNLICWANWVDTVQNMADFYAFLDANDVAGGGPDTAPSRSVHGYRAADGRVGGVDYRSNGTTAGRMVLCYAYEYPPYITAAQTIDDVINFGVGNTGGPYQEGSLRANYMIWSYISFGRADLQWSAPNTGIKARLVARDFPFPASQGLPV